VTSAANAALANGHASRRRDRRFAFRPRKRTRACGVVAAAFAMAERSAPEERAASRVRLGYVALPRLDQSLNRSSSAREAFDATASGRPFGGRRRGRARGLDEPGARHLLLLTRRNRPPASPAGCATKSIRKKLRLQAACRRATAFSAPRWSRTASPASEELFLGERQFLRRLRALPDPAELARELGERYEI